MGKSKVSEKHKDANLLLQISSEFIWECGWAGAETRKTNSTEHITVDQVHNAWKHTCKQKPEFIKRLFSSCFQELEIFFFF